MTSKNSLSNQKIHQGVFDLRLIFVTIRRNLWLPVLACLGFFFGIPVVTAMLLQNGLVDLSKLGAEEQAAQIQNVMTSVVEINQGISIAIIIVGALLAAMTMFHYLQRKKQMDFYHALPVSRGKWFVTNYLAGFFVFLLPFLAATLLNVLVICLFGHGGDFFWGVYAHSLLNHILFFLAIYSAVIFAIMLTGTMLAALQVTTLLLAVGPAVVGIYSLICSMFYPTFYTALWDWNYWLMGVSPVARYIASSQYALSGMAYTLLILFIVIMVGLAFFLYRLRPSEKAGVALVFPKAKWIIKYPIVLVGAAVFGIVFYGAGNHLFWLFFGAICGAIICNQILEIWYAADFKAIKKNWLGAGIAVVLICAFFGAVTTDLTGYNDYLPEQSEVARVNLVMDNVNNYGDGTELYQMTRDAYWDGKEREEYRLQAYTLEQPEEIAAALTLAQAGIDGSQQTEVGLRGYQVTDELAAEEYYQTTSLGIVYTLQNGKQIARYYHYVPIIGENATAVASILDSQSYREGYYDIQRVQPEQLYVMGVTPLDTNTFHDVKGFSEASQRQLIQTFLEEQKNTSAEALQQQLPVGTLELKIYANPDQLPSDLTAVFDDNSSYSAYTVNYPIYAEYTDTISLLQQNLGIGQLFQPDASLITAIHIYQNGVPVALEADSMDVVVTAEETQYYGETPVRDVTDPAEIAEILQRTYSSEAFSYSPFICYDSETRYECEYRDHNVVDRYEIAK